MDVRRWVTHRRKWAQHEYGSAMSLRGHHVRDVRVVAIGSSLARAHVKITFVEA